MIYPTLYIDQNNNQNLINIFDTEFDNENPVLSMEGDKEVFCQHDFRDNDGI